MKRRRNSLPKGIANSFPLLQSMMNTPSMLTTMGGRSRWYCTPAAGISRSSGWSKIYDCDAILSAAPASTRAERSSGHRQDAGATPAAAWRPSKLSAADRLLRRLAAASHWASRASVYSSGRRSHYLAQPVPWAGARAELLGNVLPALR